MFKIDTGERFIDITAQSAAVDESQNVKITTRGRAITLTNKIIEAIQSHECPDQLADYWERETLVLDALHLFDPHVTAHLRDLFDEHRAALIHGGAYQSAQAVPPRTASGFPPAQNGNTDKGNDNGF
jgi:hypothetical protein